ncbi:TPA: RepB protein, partial [Enterococcus faecalis]|nr:RepB protein [Enterococcus faecalis]HCR3481691.1 RepB protein [Enterococcus faecalis]
EAYSKRNIAKYLKKAIEQYLPTVRGSVIENMADLLKKNRG